MNDKEENEKEYNIFLLNNMILLFLSFVWIRHT